MPYTIATTNEPEVLKEVDDATFVDLQRLGLLQPGKGDVNGNGQLKRAVAQEAPLEVTQAVPSAALGAQSSPDTTQGA